jgi:HSP20 family protein
MELMRWDPFRALRRRDDAFDDLFREFFRPGEGGPMAPAAEVAESDGDVVVKLEVPGVEKDQITISVTDDVVTVRGEIRKESEEKKKSFYRQEIRYGAFERMLGLPAEVDASKAAAELKNGMLKITLPKTKQPKAHQVKVAVA